METARDAVVRIQESPFGADTAASLQFLRAPAVWACFVFFFFSTAAYAVLQNYGPALLIQLYEFEVARAALVVSVLMFGAAAGTVAGGFMALPGKQVDRVVATAMALSALLALALASAVVLMWLVFPVVALMGVCLGIAGPSRDMLVRRAATQGVGHSTFGRVYGFVYAGLGGFAVSPLLIGPLLDAGHFAAALVAVAILNSASVLSALAIGRRASRGR